MYYSTILKLGMSLQMYKVCILFIIAKICSNGMNAEAGLHTNQFAVHISGDLEAANSIAEKYGFVNHGQIGSLKGYFLFEHHSIEKRSASPSSVHSQLLQNDSAVLWFEQQEIKRRVKRGMVTEISPEFTDPLYSDQWFLHGGASGGFDMNVIPAWKNGFTGKGVVVSILDDGVQSAHPDLAQNYDKDASWDANDSDDDPTPQDNNNNRHGTRCAGEVAAVAYNEFCGVGIAYNASIGGVRMLDGSVTDNVEATALSLRPDHIHIYSASWGPEDNGKTVDGPGTLAQLALENGINKGRAGLGSIFVWASGNGGKHNDSCNCDGYANSIYTISISSATQGGLMPWYLEQCSSTLATTYSSGSSSDDLNIATVDLNYSYFDQIRRGQKPDTSSLCTREHTGTSASAPIAAAICALALEANPILNWRDMQYLIVMTSRYKPLAKEPGWVRNGVGKRVSTKFGYGLMDAGAIVKLAKGWKSVPKQRICFTTPDTTERLIPNVDGAKVETSANATGCKGKRNNILYLEHVQVKISLNFHPRGNLHIMLISPSGTRSTVLLPRGEDSKDSAFKDWPFMSVHFWGESPEGNWKLIITNVGILPSNMPGKLTEWSLVFYGIDEGPIILAAKDPKFEILRATEKAHDHLIHRVDKLVEVTNPCFPENQFQVTAEGQNDCRDKCPVGQYGDLKDYMCHTCDKSCSSCYGPSYNNCLACPLKYFLLKNMCVKSCPDSYFSDTVNHQCYPCLSSCATCELSHYVCKSCKSGLYLYNQECLPVCPYGTYMHGNVCYKCHESCTTCYGAVSSNCLSCPAAFYLYNYSCLRQCPLHFYSEDDIRCSRCHRSCETCSDNTSCSTCALNWELDSSYNCIWNSQCQRGWNNKDTDTCENCRQHLCSQCSGPDVYDCIYCKEGSMWIEGKCTRSCDEGYFVSKDECHPCNENCLRCTEEENECISCKYQFVLHEGKCVSACPLGYFYDGSKKCQKCFPECLHCNGPTEYNCTACHLGFYLLDHTCQSGCPDGHFPINAGEASECLPCYPTCKTCSDFGSMRCTSCYDSSSLKDGICVPCLDAAFYNATSKKCERCHDKCGRCNGPSSNQCLSCPAPFRLDEVRHTCLACCSDLTEKESECCTCSKDLDICVNSDHPRSVRMGGFTAQDSDEVVIPIKHVVSIVIAICASVVLLFMLLFGTLQAKSAGWCNLKLGEQRYERVPNHITAKFDADMEKVSLTQDDLDEEDDIYEKV